MANSADPDQLASSLIWIDTICKGRVYPGSAGQELMANSAEPEKPTDRIYTVCKGRVYPGSAGQELKRKLFSLCGH